VFPNRKIRGKVEGQTFCLYHQLHGTIIKDGMAYGFTSRFSSDTMLKFSDRKSPKLGSVNTQPAHTATISLALA
jgi:hypothetical protein